ncbi:MAG TPA: hypothetical protein VH306_12745 [Gaiellaceae bacterium]
MIVRLMGEGQFEVDDDCAGRLNELDDKALAALEAGDEAELDRLLDEMAALVRSEGTPLRDDDLSPSDAIVPPSDLTLEETRALMSDEGLIPDLPA